MVLLLKKYSFREIAMIHDREGNMIFRISVFLIDVTRLKFFNDFQPYVL